MNINIFDNYLNSGIQLYKQEKYDEAIIEFKKAKKENNKNPFSYDWIGLSYEAKGKYIRALFSFDRARMLDSTNLDFHHHFNECNMLGFFNRIKNWQYRNYVFIEKIKNNPLFIPKYFNKHKYRNLNIAYRYMKNNKHTIKMLKDCEIYLQDPKKFNDPFDTLLNIQIEYNYKDLIKLFPGFSFNEKALQQLERKRTLTIDAIDPILLYKASPEYFISLFPLQKRETEKDKRQRIVHDLKNGNSRKYSLQNNPETIGHITSMLRTICFTERTDDILMWSHYANMHKGICIGFKTYEKFNNIKYFKCNGDDLKHDAFNHVEHGFAPFIKIVYKNMRNTIYKFLAGNPIIDINKFYKMILTKGKAWKYEREYRIVIPQDDLLAVDNDNKKKYTIRFSPKEIDTIIFGINANSKYKKAIYKIINNYEDHGIWITFYQCFLGKNNNIIDIKKIIYDDLKNGFIEVN